MISCLPTIANAAAGLRRGDLTSAELVECCLARIERLEPQIGAWVVVDAAGARRKAAQLDEWGRSGNWQGPLHGVPLGIKDIIDVAGLPTRAGSPLLDDHLASEDAELVRVLRSAGAIILGKTVTTEFACFHPSQTRNPWNPEHTPGGSSSGSAAAVACQMCMAAIGSQTGGSIVRPASYCGVAGFKPTQNVVSLSGVVPVSGRLDHAGPLARSAQDLIQLHAVLSGGEVARRLLDPTPPELHRIEEYFFQQAEESCCSAVRSCLDELGAAQAEPFLLPELFSLVHAMHRRIMYVDAAENHEGSFRQQRDQYSPTLAKMLDEGLSISGVDYARAVRHQRAFRQAIESCFATPTTLAVTPATPAAAPAGLESTGDPSFNSPWTYAGLPTATVPCGFDAAGMPVGLQLVGGMDNDWEVLRAAAWCEAKWGRQWTPPLVDDC